VPPRTGATLANRKQIADASAKQKAKKQKNKKTKKPQ
jgi:hypothetical protein